MTRNEVLEKLRKLYLHQKSAKDIGSEAEAQAFALKIQELLNSYKLNLSDIDWRHQDEVDPTAKRRVDFKSAGIPYKRARIAWQEELARVVCRAHFCRMLVVQGSSMLYFVGSGTDLDACESTFLYLLQVASRLSEIEYVRYFHQCRKAGNVKQARGFKASYLSGFSSRLAERYDEAVKKLQSEHAGTALVRLKDAVSKVDDYMAKMRAAGETSAVRGSFVTPKNMAGLMKGRLDADRVPIGTNEKQVEAGRKFS